MKRISKIGLTIVLMVSTVEFIRSNSAYYLSESPTLEMAGQIGNSGSLMILAVAGLAIINSFKKEI